MPFNKKKVLSEIGAGESDLHLKTFNTSWDYFLDEQHSIREISLAKVRKFIIRSNKMKTEPIKDDPMTVLKKFELVRNGKITYGAFLLFMEGESAISTIELGRFQTETVVKDGARFKTDLFSEVDAVMQFVQKHLNKAYIISGKPQREERWDYPLDALREIIVNAIVHRNRAQEVRLCNRPRDDRGSHRGSYRGSHRGSRKASSALSRAKEQTGIAEKSRASA